MLRSALTACAGLMLFLFVVPAGAQQRQVLPTRVSTPTESQLIGWLPGTQRLNLAISLPLRNPEQLDSLLQQLYDPASPRYRHFLTVAQFTEQFGATAAEYSQVIHFAEMNGFTVTHTFTSRLLLNVNAQVSDIEKAFQVTMQVYQHPTENRHFFAPDVEPSVDAGLPILSVEGLSDFNLPHPMLRRASPAAPLTSNTTGSGAGGQFLGSDMRVAYGGGTTLDGSGQVVGLIELGPYRFGDVQSYFTSLGQPLNVPIVNVLLSVDGVCSVTEPSPGPCDDGEEAIDIQQAIAMAPNLSALIVYEAYGSASDALTAYTQAANDNIAKQLSISFGWGGTPGNSLGYEQVFQQLAAQGISSFVASGDSGANQGGGGYPGNSPNITDAGGTDLTTGTNQVWVGETGWVGSGAGWNTAVPIPVKGVKPSDGGPVDLWTQPPSILSATGVGGNPSFRNIPDVAAEANTDNYFCANGSCQGGIGGTSLAAPRWAAFMALINQQAAANATSANDSNGPIGFLNPTIYSIGQGAGYSTALHDITSGSNPCSWNPCNGSQSFTATMGFDLVTGWGSPNGPSVFNVFAPTSSNPNFTLSSSPSLLPLTPGGGGTSSISLAALNGFSAVANLTVVLPGATGGSAPAGLSASLSAASIAAVGGPVTLTISTTSATPGGTYVVAVVGTSGTGCSGAAGGCLTQTAYVTVALPAFLGLSSSPAGGVVLNQGSTATSTIAIVGINGFNSAVNLSASGLPSGVTASFVPVNSTTSTLTLTASSTATLTRAAKPYAVAVTGTAAGSSPQSTLLNLFVNPPTTGGSGTPVDLSAAYNVYAFYKDANESSISAANSLDGVGFAYSADLLQSGLDFNGTQFTLGPANLPDSVSGNKTIPLPAGSYTSLQMLATGVQGNQTSQNITVTYTDSTTSQFTQSFSDWCSALNGGGCSSTGSNSGESVAVAMPYRDSAGGPDNRVFYLYGYSFALNTNKTVQSVTLPNNRNVTVLAASLAGQVATGYTISAAPSTLSVALGNSKTSTITVMPTGGFTGTASLSASGLPSGVTASFNPASTATTSTLTITASSSATTGPATVTVTGTSGSLTQTATINLTVTASPSYSLSAGAANPGSISPGSSSIATITVTPANGYTGMVALSCSISPVVTGAGAPTCTFGSTSPVSITNGSNTATMTFNTVSASAAMNFARQLYAIWLSIPGLALIGLGFAFTSFRRKKLSGVIFFGILLGGLIAISGCGGGSNGGGGGNPGTPAGNYTVAVTAKDANGMTPSNTSPVMVAITVN